MKHFTIFPLSFIMNISLTSYRASCVEYHTCTNDIRIHCVIGGVHKDQCQCGKNKAYFLGIVCKFWEGILLKSHHFNWNYTMQCDLLRHEAKTVVNAKINIHGELSIQPRTDENLSWQSTMSWGTSTRVLMHVDAIPVRLQRPSPLAKSLGLSLFLLLLINTGIEEAGPRAISVPVAAIDALEFS